MHERISHPADQGQPHEARQSSTVRVGRVRRRRSEQAAS
jgi:hypothetical protein